MIYSIYHILRTIYTIHCCYDTERRRQDLEIPKIVYVLPPFVQWYCYICILLCVCVCVLVPYMFYCDVSSMQYVYGFVCVQLCARYVLVCVCTYAAILFLPTVE